MHMRRQFPGLQEEVRSNTAENKHVAARAIPRCLDRCRYNVRHLKTVWNENDRAQNWIVARPTSVAIQQHLPQSWLMTSEVDAFEWPFCCDSCTPENG